MRSPSRPRPELTKRLASGALLRSPKSPRSVETHFLVGGGAEVLAPRYTGLRGFNGRESPVLNLAVRGFAAALRVCVVGGYGERFPSADALAGEEGSLAEKAEVAAYVPLLEP